MLGTPPPSPRLLQELATAPDRPLPSEQQLVHSWVSAAGGKESDTSVQEPQTFDIADPDDSWAFSPPNTPPHDAHLRAKLAIAQEQRVAFLSAVATLAHTEAEIKRCAEEQQTARYRIYADMAAVMEEAKTKRFVKAVDGMTEGSQLEHHTTRRRDAQTHQQELARIEKAPSSQPGSGLMHWLCTAVLGLYTLAGRGGSDMVFVQQAAGARGLSYAPTLAGKMVKRRRLLPPLLPTMIAVSFLRFLWLNAWARNAILAGRGPLSVVRLRELLRKALDVLQRTGDRSTPSGRSRGEPDALAIAAPEVQPDAWDSRPGPDGRRFYHHKNLGPAPWDMQVTTYSQSHRQGSIGNNSIAGAAPMMGRCGSLCTPRSEVLKDKLGALLANWGLGSYAEELVQLGYNVDTLRLLPKDEAETVLQMIQCRPEHKSIFQEALQSWH
mmetsp:Transcript_14798/g.33664  ORF Transcript_14798/g.33664 Transcript_14798/m.33664 type:complete len:438 (+) Transcript_14798:71-1384(+)